MERISEKETGNAEHFHSQNRVTYGNSAEEEGATTGESQNGGDKKKTGRDKTGNRETGCVSRMKNKRRYFGNYKKKVGLTQKDAVEFYHTIGKSVDEIQNLLQCPRASIRGRLSELKKQHG